MISGTELPDRQVTLFAENAKNGGLTHSGPPLDHVPATRQVRRRDMLAAILIGLMLAAGALGLLMGWPK